MKMFKSIAEWRKEIPENYRSERVELVEKRKGIKTIRITGLLYHSQYNPIEEAKKLVEGSSLDKKRPVVVVGLGLGYHIQELIQKEYKIIVIEPDKDVAFTAIQNNLLPDD
ncbi:MAG: motility associated factor glycosyltransferase family protein, partial [Candidatus Hydrogenedens sp.]